MIHKLKIETKYLDAILFAGKNFEIRKNDRNYQSGDVVILSEKGGTGRVIAREITYITDFAQKDGWVVFSLGKINGAVFINFDDGREGFFSDERGRVYNCRVSKEIDD